MIQILIDSSKNERTHVWSRVEFPALWIEFLSSIPAVWRQVSTNAKAAQLQIIQMLLHIGADPNQKHRGIVLWAKTLEELRHAAKESKMIQGVTEETEMIEMYKDIFLACSVDQGLAI